MGRPADAYRRIGAHAIQQDIVRGVIAVVILLLLLIGGFTLLPALSLSAIAYSGLRLFAANLGQSASPTQQLKGPRTPQVALAACKTVRTQLGELQKCIDDERVPPRLLHISERIDQLMDALHEDEQYDDAPALLDLMETTVSLLIPFAKALRRGLHETDVVGNFQRDLTILESAFDLLWARVNRGTIVSLESISEMIAFNLGDRQSSKRNGGT